MSTAWATGSCLCGAVQYKLSREPDDVERIICHCVLCKKASGSAFMTNWWITDNGVFQVTAGQDRLSSFVVTQTMTNSEVTRTFCSGCGTPIHLRTTNPEVAGKIGITAGSLDFDKQLPADQNRALNWMPGFELFTEDRLTGLAPVAGAVQIDCRKDKAKA